MAVITNPIPAREPIEDGSGLVSHRWLGWFTRLRKDVDESPRSILPLFRLSAIAGAVAFTALPIAPLAAGWYRVNASVRVTTAAGVTSSGAAAFRFTTGAVLNTVSGPTNATNVVTTPVTQVHFVEVDDGSAVEYQITYASNAAGVARFELSVLVERVPG